MTLNHEVVRAIAHLARLELSATEEQEYLEQLEHILGYFKSLDEVDTTGVEPATEMVNPGDVLREDVAVNPPAEDEFLANAPARHGRFFRVPKIID
ncbi:MAG: Asp-tRNA(Asn)/Glu-tRNA(Gln) amidotransferase subunit GatC [Candidatus Binatia bacterium]|nr:Asp-tRNA(Asn)/Glu-tRNA(Gln) amidotransferase subunit GatC [Candidatus Binatia bacterium]